MDRTILAQRAHKAHGRILQAVQYLADRHGLPDEYAALQGAGDRYRDPDVRALFESEALADFLERLVTAGVVTGKEASQGTEPMSLEALDITPTARLSLIAAGVTDVPLATAFSDDELLSISGVGPATVRALREAAPQGQGSS